MPHLKLFVFEPILSGVLSWASVTGLVAQMELDPSLIEKGGAMGALFFVIWFFLNKFWNTQEKTNEHIATLSGSTKDLVGAVNDLKDVVNANKCKAGKE